MKQPVGSRVGRPLSAEMPLSLGVMTLVTERMLKGEWEAALLDAGLQGGDIALWPCEGFADSGDVAPACSYPPERDFDDARFRPALERAGYDLEAERRPRVAVFTDFYDVDEDGGAPVEALLAGLLRHELEHVRQHCYWSALGVNLFELDGLVDRVLGLKAEGIGALFNAKPTESDANAAASRYLQTRYDDARQAIHQGRRLGELARYPAGPEPIRTLVPRLAAFSLLVRTQLEEHAAAYQEPTATLIEYWGSAGTGELWRELASVLDSWAPNGGA
jgi:hypothetical protein